MRKKSQKPKWAKGLGAKQLAHLRETSATGRLSLAGLKRNLESQAATGIECLECRCIASRLGISLPQAKDV